MDVLFGRYILAQRFFSIYLSGQDTSTTHDDDKNEFQAFFLELQAEISESGEETENINEEEARELFHLMKAEYSEVMSMDLEDIGLASDETMMSSGDDEMVMSSGDAGIEGQISRHDAAMPESVQSGAVLEEGGSTETFGTSNSPPVTSSVGDSWTKAVASSYQTSDQQATSKSTFAPTFEFPSTFSENVGIDSSSRSMPVFDHRLNETIEVVDEGEVELASEELKDLRHLLPPFSDKRLKRILRTFHKSLGDPSLLDLIPILRERMPDYVTNTWLKQMSTLTAQYVMRKASAEELVDKHVLNGVLELEALSGSLDRALAFYETAFAQHGIAPTEYSNRMILQMFLRTNRLSRALAFRDKLKEKGRTLDILAYGSLVEYCARHGQIGSSMLLLEECLSVHGSPPGEAYLKALRVACRKADLGERLSSLVGEDPNDWLRHGQANLKREMSKRGRRDVQLARNRLVQL